jgi:hypothetical protein
LTVWRAVGMGSFLSTMTLQFVGRSTQAAKWMAQRTASLLISSHPKSPISIPFLS